MNPWLSPFKLKGPGPEAWCKRCSRVHPRRKCELVEIERFSHKRLNEDGTKRRGGHKCMRLAHPKKQPKRHKRRARKS